ncbi:hypothetical protein Tco_0242818 [Tanacetum coccineum]
MSCLPDDIMELVISCEIAKTTWTALVHSFEGPSDTKENMIIDLKLEFQTFTAKPYESLSRTYTYYKTMLNELANDGVTLSKHEINVGFVNSLPEKITRSQRDTQDFQENSDNEADERTSEEYLRDLDIEFHERALLANSKRFIKRKNKFSIQKANEDTKCYKCEKSVKRDYKTEYKKMKAKLALLEASPATSQSSKPFQSKNKGLVAEMLNWDEEEVYDNKEETRVQVLMALTDDELSCRDDLLALKQAKLEAVTFQIQNTKPRKLNHALQDQLKEERKKILGGEQLTESSSKNDAKDNPFVPASLDYDHEMVLKSKDWVERLNPDNKLPNFNTRRILVPESEAVNECLKLTEASSDPESSKDSGSEP